jgi:hypothetical protein
MLATCTVNDPSVTVLPATVIEPSIWLPRPVAVVSTPPSTSCTR